MPLEEKLNFVLREDINSVVMRERNLYQQLAGTLCESIVLFGCGVLGNMILTGLRKRKIFPLAFTDNDPQKWGKEINGLIVLTPKEAAQKYAKKAVFVVTIWNRGHAYLKTKNQLKKLQCRKIIPFQALMWRYSEEFLPYYFFDLPHNIQTHAIQIKEAFKLLNGRISRHHYVGYLLWRGFLDFGCLPDISDHNQYFPNFIKPLKNEVFIDCGSFNGDTISIFLSLRKKIFKQIIGFEPDPKNYNKLVQFRNALDRTVRNKIRVYPYAVGSNNDLLNFNSSASEQSCVIFDGKSRIKSITLDQEISNNKPTFLKFDIEGYEIEALKGCQKIIQKYNPVIAISIYHWFHDLWSIPLYIHSLTDQYNYYIRTYDYDGREVILYAVPKNRLNLI